MYCRTVATIVILPREAAEFAQRTFVPTKEVRMLLAVSPDELYGSRIFDRIPSEFLHNARKIFPSSEIRHSYLKYHFQRDRHLDALLTARDLRVMCQVEVPKQGQRRYKNIDIGFTSNGKREVTENPIDASIRETREESRIILDRRWYSRKYQQALRKKYQIDSMPYIVRSPGLWCYILVIDPNPN